MSIARSGRYTANVAIVAAPTFLKLETVTSPIVATLLILVPRTVQAGYTANNALVKAELFPASIRATGVGVPYAFAVSIFGGSAEYVALWFKQAGMESSFYWYATGVIACTLLVCWFMRDTKVGSLIDAELKG